MRDQRTGRGARCPRLGPRQLQLFEVAQVWAARERLRSLDGDGCVLERERGEPAQPAKPDDLNDPVGRLDELERATRRDDSLEQLGLRLRERLRIYRAHTFDETAERQVASEPGRQRGTKLVHDLVVHDARALRDDQRRVLGDAGAM